eukprot:529296-Prymnesium_polylepis.2
MRSLQARVCAVKLVFSRRPAGYYRHTGRCGAPSGQAGTHPAGEYRSRQGSTINRHSFTIC